MSWAEDMGLDGYDGEAYVSDTENYEWEDRDHKVRPIRDLETSHIRHIVSGLEKGKSFYEQEGKLPYLYKELDRRHQTKVS